jgi:hypothetical protein
MSVEDIYGVSKEGIYDQSIFDTFNNEFDKINRDYNFLNYNIPDCCKNCTNNRNTACWCTMPHLTNPVWA